MSPPTPVTPPPGSDAALDAGCTCPVLDNAHGRGAWLCGREPLYWIRADCPLHATTAAPSGEGAP